MLDSFHGTLIVDEGDFRFSDEKAEVVKILNNGNVKGFPVLRFANLPERKRTQWALTKEEVKNCVWLKPQFVAQIDFTEWTPDGYLSHSKFCGVER
jgi:ATP-dependent DNA ligase